MKINNSEKTNISDLHIKLKILFIAVQPSQNPDYNPSIQTQILLNLEYCGALFQWNKRILFQNCGEKDSMESIWVRERKTKLIKENIVLSFYVAYLSFKFNITFWDFKTDTSGILFSFPIYMSVIIPQSCRTAFLTDIRSRFRTVEMTPVGDPWWSERKSMHW